MPNVTYQTPAELIETLASLISDVKIQIAATTYNPVGLVDEMTPGEHGVSVALKAPGNATSILAANAANHHRGDAERPGYVVLGYSADALGQIDWELNIVHVGEGTDTTKVADHTILVSRDITVVNGYVYDVFDVPAGDVGTRLVKMNLKRLGASDANNGTANIEGFLFAYKAKGAPTA